MIPVEQLQDESTIDIPRASGDDPSSKLGKSLVYKYSPRERG